MNILLINDDGCYAEGTIVLKELLLERGYLVCLALPWKNCSGYSSRIHINEMLSFSVTDEQTIIVKGSPVDCFHVGVAYWKQCGIKFDIIISGINEGMNIGASQRYSGTYAAALEGIHYGYPAMAISCQEKIYKKKK